eukprot:bmy_21906T0
MPGVSSAHRFSEQNEFSGFFWRVEDGHYKLLQEGIKEGNYTESWMKTLCYDLTFSSCSLSSTTWRHHSPGATFRGPQRMPCPALTLPSRWMTAEVGKTPPSNDFMRPGILP